MSAMYLFLSSNCCFGFLWFLFHCPRNDVSILTESCVSEDSGPNNNLLILRCRHTAGRSSLQPYGNSGYQFVEDGNTLATRTILLILVAQWKGLRWILEQPDGSFFPQLPRFQWLLKILKVRGHITIAGFCKYIYIHMWVIYFWIFTMCSNQCIYIHNYTHVYV